MKQNQNFRAKPSPTLWTHNRISYSREILFICKITACSPISDKITKIHAADL